MGTISGIEAGDTVRIGNNSGDPNQPDLQVNVIGTGGNVTIGSGSNVQVTNTGTPPGTNINVTLPSGDVVIVPPGSPPVTFSTF